MIKRLLGKLGSTLISAFSFPNGLYLKVRLNFIIREIQNIQRFRSYPQLLQAGGAINELDGIQIILINNINCNQEDQIKSPEDFTTGL